MVKKFKEIGGAKVYRGWKNWVEGEYIQGVLTGTSVDNYNKTNWHIQITETNIEDEDEIIEGVTIGLNSCGSLDFKMVQVAEGETVYIEYNGKGELTKGKFAGKEFHEVIVKVMGDDDDDSELSNPDDLGSFADL